VKSLQVFGKSIVITGNKLHDRAQYECQDRYKYVGGNLTSICQNNSSWASQTESCV